MKLRAPTSPRLTQALDAAEEFACFAEVLREENVELTMANLALHRTLAKQTEMLQAVYFTTFAFWCVIVVFGLALIRQ